MASTALRACAVSFCPEYADHGSIYCVEHGKHKSDHRNAHRKREANPIYKTDRWQRLRKLILHRSPACVDCKQPATVVDHIIAMSQGGSEFDESNLQTLCDACHNQKRQREAVELPFVVPSIVFSRDVEVFAGPPFSDAPQAAIMKAGGGTVISPYSIARSFWSDGFEPWRLDRALFVLKLYRTAIASINDLPKSKVCVVAFAPTFAERAAWKRAGALVHLFRPSREALQEVIRRTAWATGNVTRWQEQIDQWFQQFTGDEPIKYDYLRN